MIDIQHEKLMTFTEAAALVPKRRQGRKVSQATLWRWQRAMPGCSSGPTRENPAVGSGLRWRLRRT